MSPEEKRLDGTLYRLRGRIEDYIRQEAARVFHGECTLMFTEYRQTPRRFLRLEIEISPDLEPMLPRIVEVEVDPIESDDPENAPILEKKQLTEREGCDRIGVKAPEEPASAIDPVSGGRVEPSESAE